MLGDETTGKTALLNHYISGFVHVDITAKTGVDFYSKTTVYHGRKVKLHVWVFGDEERFQFLMHQYCKGADAALFLYNITIPSSLDHLRDWNQIIREQAGNIPIMLVGTRAHLEEQRAVTKDQCIQAAQIHNPSGFIEVSSKTGQNVDHLFEAMIKILFNKELTKKH